MLKSTVYRGGLREVAWGEGGSDVQLHHLNKYTIQRVLYGRASSRHDIGMVGVGAVLTFGSDDYVFAVVGY